MIPCYGQSLSTDAASGGLDANGNALKGTTYYKRLLASVRTAKASCDAAGLTMCVPCFTWTQGEEDMRAGGDDEVELTLSRTPVSGERLTYGVNGDYWQWITGVRGELPEGEVNDNATKSGSLHGARGCLRDSSPLKNNDNPSDKLKNLYNWCVIFEIIL